MSRAGTSPVWLLREPKFEVLPFGDIDEYACALPAGASVTVTSSPKKGIGATLEWTNNLAQRGFEVAPHIAARSVRDTTHLENVVQRLVEAGVTDIFVPAGDNPEPAGEFTSSYELLTVLEEIGNPFANVGITGYPEGHHFLSEQTLWAALEKKRPYATYMVTQLCFDPGAIVAWVHDVRRRGIELPVEVGIPGAVTHQKLLNISLKIGVGDSIRFLRKTTGVLGFVKRLLTSSRYTPDDIVAGIAPYTHELSISGLHLYTFNQVEETETWRQEMLTE